MSNQLTALYTGAMASLAQSRDCAALLTAINDRSGGPTIARPVTVLELTLWAAPAIRARLEDAKSDPSNPARSIALAALDLLAKPFDTQFNTVAHAALLDALQAVGVITADDRAALTAMATKPISLAEKTIGRQATLNDIWESLE